MTRGPTLVLMAAGLGSRYGRPKQIDAVGPSGETLLDYAVFDARRAGFERVVFVIRAELEGTFAESIRRFPDDLTVRLALQSLDALPAARIPFGARTRPWGTVHALVSARAPRDAPVVVLNADDFYGEETYRVAMAASIEAGETGEASVVALRLAETLSAHGPVVRAICRTEDGRLTGLEELHAIERTAAGIRGRTRRGDARQLTGDELVSMNFWVFPGAAVGLLEDEFSRFLVTDGHQPDAELPLPEAVDALVARGSITVRVRLGTGPWFGLTHAQDRPGVSAAISALVGRGDYPSPLWRQDEDRGV